MYCKLDGVPEMTELYLELAEEKQHANNFWLMLTLYTFFFVT